MIPWPLLCLLTVGLVVCCVPLTALLARTPLAGRRRVPWHQPGSRRPPERREGRHRAAPPSAGRSGPVRVYHSPPVWARAGTNRAAFTVPHPVALLYVPLAEKPGTFTRSALEAQTELLLRSAAWQYV